MMHKPKFILTILLFVSLAFNANATRDFTWIAEVYNTRIFFETNALGKEGNQTTRVLGLLVHKLSKKLKKEHIQITIKHNLRSRFEYGRDAIDTAATVYSLAIGFDSIQFKNTFGQTLEGTITIYYRGEFSIEKYLLIAYYSLTHIDEIKARQKQIYLPNLEGRESDIAVPETELNINYSRNDIVDDILKQKIYRSWIWPSTFPNLSYYYSNRQYHIIKVTSPRKQRYDLREVPVSGTELLAIDEISEIIRFPDEDYLVFTSDTVFYYIGLDSNSVSGPHSIPYVNMNFYEPRYLLDHYTYGDMLIFKIPFALQEGPVTIKFDKKKKVATSDYLEVKLKANLKEWIRKHPYPPDVKPDPPNKTVAYFLLSVLLINTIAILISSRKQV